MKVHRLFKVSNDIPVASMSDIAFLLIVFFMIAAVFASEAGLVINLPAKDAKPIKVSDQALIEIEIRQDNRLWLDGKPINKKELNDWLNQRNNQQTYVVIKADKRSNFQTLITTIEQFKINNIDKISIKRLK